MSLTWTLASVILLYVLVTGLAGTVDTASFWEKFRGPGKASIAIGVGCQFVLLPLLGFAAVNVFDVHAVVAVMLMVTTSSPGGSYSNWWCSLCNADLALSVAMTTVSSMASAFMLPLNIFLYVTVLYDREEGTCARASGFSLARRGQGRRLPTGLGSRGVLDTLAHPSRFSSTQCPSTLVR